MNALLLIETAAAEPRADELAEALRRAGLDLETAPLGGQESQGEGATAALTGALREVERLLAERRPAAVLISGDGDPALAAALVAAKLTLPFAVVGKPVGPNAGLLAQLAGEPLPVDPGVIAAWLRRAGGTGGEAVPHDPS